MEASLLLRNGEQLLLALVIPAGLLLAWRFVLPPSLVDPQTFPASVLALAVWSTGFTSLAITTAFELRHGVLERLAATPLRPADLILGKSLATAAIAVAQLIVLAGLAIMLGWRPGAASAATFGWGGVAGPASVLLAMLDAVVALVAFASLALALATRLRAEIVLGLANLIYLAGAAAGLVYPVPALWWLPTSALGEAFRGSAEGFTPIWPSGVLVVWGLAAVLIARKVFRWMS